MRFLSAPPTNICRRSAWFSISNPCEMHFWKDKSNRFVFLMVTGNACWGLVGKALSFPEASSGKSVGANISRLPLLSKHTLHRGILTSPAVTRHSLSRSLISALLLNVFSHHIRESMKMANQTKERGLNFVYFFHGRGAGMLISYL